MTRRFLHHMRRHAVAYLAIFVAMGGTSYAAIKIPNNSVGNKQLKKNAVDATKVGDGKLTTIEFKAGQVPAGQKGPKGDQGDPGATGEPGVRGLKGEQGDKGAPAPGGATVATLNSGTDAARRKPAGPPDAVVRSQQFTTTAASTTVIFRGSILVDISCGDATPNANCVPNEIGLFVDGNGIPGSLQSFSGFPVPESFSFPGLTLSASGVVAGIGPGTHTLQFGFKHGTANHLSVIDRGGSAYLMIAPQ